ncbi:MULTISPECIES: type VI secretion system Vgr family protein [unclassified Salinivibrio]|uniref:type VI secretion system Vgr family protein n=1 Tax=unclassified Salinivibrio TaxID=2636825 RepID=UPI0009877C37|nr:MULTISPECIES: type VI secretion system tip protein TssI/VgrG [unclassified Salinivibrio]OOE88250.1 type IV secretion protein Rhs [Salinivibrio sp. AR640]OOE91518.1 type IV secretion protein Rhs [Salinivibrio sp. AR647]
MAKLRFEFSVEGLEPDTFVVREYQGNESLSAAAFDQQACNGFRYSIALASRDHSLTPDQLVDCQATLALYRNGQCERRIRGIIRQFSQGDIGHHHTYYDVELVAEIERLSLRQNSRVFQHQTVPQVISILLQEMRITDVGFGLTKEYAEREFCVQYRETDLAFFHRIAAEEGLMYCFVWKEDKQLLYITDSPFSLPALKQPIVHNAQAAGVVDEPYIRAIEKHTRIIPSSLEMKDYSFKKPNYSFLQQVNMSGIDHQRQDYDVYDFPGRYKDDTQGKHLTQIRQEFLARDKVTATGESNHFLVQAGHAFEMQDHLDRTMNQKWQVVRAQHYGTQPQAVEEEGGTGATTYHNRFTVIPASIPWRATPHPKPQVDGPLIGIVVGPEGEEIFCDEHGRVKVHFPWDRYSSGNDKSSCWIRVSQGWAGSQYGMMAIPRIGHEVIVSFLHGDPDQPIITGRTYHATNVSPYTLPAHKTKTVWRSESHQGEGYNELTFEDQSGSEQVYLHAQRDWQSDVENDVVTQVRHNEHQKVDHDSLSAVMSNQHVTVDKQSRTRVKKDATIAVSGGIHEKIDNRFAATAGREVHLKAGANVVLDAGTEVTVTAGGSVMKVDAAGVHLIGPAINLNAGGSPGSGSGYQGQPAKSPRSVNKP